MNDIQIIIASLLFSGLFSGLEIAFISSSRLLMEVEKKGSSRPWLYNMYKHPSKVIATLLLGNNVALVFYGFAAASLLQEPISSLLGSYSQYEFLILLLQTIISTIAILIVAEFIPKALFSINPNKVLRFFTLPVFIFYYLFNPIVNFVYWIASNILIHLFGLKITEELSDISGVELKDLVSDINDHEESVVIGEDEKEIFKNVIDFRSIKIRECLIPRTEISAVEITENLDVLRDLFVATGHSKVLIYRDHIDNIIGYVHSYDLFQRPKNIGSILRSIPFIPETMMAQLALSMFIKQNKSIAVVVDEFGGTSGLVTMEDIMEEIFGEIEDEHDKETIMEQQISEKEFLFAGRIEIDYINEKYNLRIPPSEEYETLAGYIIINSGNIPNEGDEVLLKNYQFIIQKATDNKVLLIKMTRLDIPKDIK